MIVDKIVIHNTGGIATNYYASSKHLTLQQIDRAHYQRWPEFKSRLGYWVGYTFIVFPDGSFKQTRLVGEEGAHTKGSNKDSVGICLTGNFTLYNGVPVEKPTKEQIDTMNRLCVALVENKLVSEGIQYDQNLINKCSYEKIYPHRFLQKGTECYGNVYPDNWARNTVLAAVGEKVGILRQMLDVLLEYIRKTKESPLGSRGNPPEPCHLGDMRG